jgi:SRSO17 transposase
MTQPILSFTLRRSLWTSTVQSIKTHFRLLRSFESFRDLHLGIISEIKMKSLPEIARVCGIGETSTIPSFFHRITWEDRKFKEAAKRCSILLIIDETGKRKQGRATDYVNRQYMGNLGKVENGIVVVTASSVIDNITFPLSFEVTRSRERLKPEDKYKTQPEIAAI